MPAYEKWIERAKRYAALAREMATRGFYPEACLFAQQAAELYLKGLLIKATGARPYTHSILHLLRSYLALSGREPGEEEARCAKLLTEHYLGARYPDARMLEYDAKDAEECLRCMDAVLNATV